VQLFKEIALQSTKNPVSAADLNRLFLATALGIAACRTAPPSTQETAYRAESQPRNIILMIGDGMGLTQVSAAMYSIQRRLNLERCPVVGLSKTHSADNLITDSAAGGTAIACGQKTYNGAIGVSADTVAIPTILEMCEAQGLATGIAVTCELTHATPAAFIAHQPNRQMVEEIAADYLKTEIDLFIGGGLGHFVTRKDGRNLVLELQDRNYQIRNERMVFSDQKFMPNQKLACFTALESPRSQESGRVYLPESVTFSANFLSNMSRKGFFLMVEGSQIDWGGHDNNAAMVVNETLDFDEAVGRALDFAAQDKHTLVIVTADHETGGLAIQRPSRQGELTMAFTTDGHTATMVPVYAYGPGSEAFGGVYDNTELFFKMVRALGLDEK
jgi:alkaline phosphatase